MCKSCCNFKLLFCAVILRIAKCSTLRSDRSRPPTTAVYASALRLDSRPEVSNKSVIKLVFQL